MYDTGPQWSTILTERLLDIDLPITGVGKDDKGQIVVHFADTATAEDKRLAAQVVDGFNGDLEVAKKRQLEVLMKDFEKAGKDGFDTGLGFRLAASTEDQNEFNKLQTSIAMFTGAGLWNNDTPITILDTKYQPHVLTIGQWQPLALGYAGHCLTLIGAMGQARAEILNAESAQAAKKVSLTQPK